MIVDSSALVAILAHERDAEYFIRAIRSSASEPKVSAGNYIEVSIVLDRREEADLLLSQLDELLEEFGIEIIPVSVTQAHIARQAHRDFGKGRHKAGLNFGDCFAYALSKEIGEPLLCKGSDFIRTDLKVLSPD